MHKIVKAAYDLAMHAHLRQVRKYTKEPYFFHCAEVACLVQCLAESTPEMIAAAYLHDVVEDTGVPITLILDRVRSVQVCNYVSLLTDPKSDLNRAARKANVVERFRTASNEVRTIKLADLISNSRSILIHDRNFARQYLTEKAELLSVLRGGNTVLYALAEQIVVDSLKCLDEVKPKKGKENAL